MRETFICSLKKQINLCNRCRNFICKYHISSNREACIMCNDIKICATCNNTNLSNYFYYCSRCDKLSCGMCTYMPQFQKLICEKCK